MNKLRDTGTHQRRRTGINSETSFFVNFVEIVVTMIGTHTHTHPSSVYFVTPTPKL